MSGVTRINSIDLLRGAVMIIMALDHTRDFFHAEAFTDNPLNLDTTTPLLFFTRWITHFCAPVFVFLSGTSIYLQSLRKSRPELSGFLIKRGLWLVIAELLIITFGITFNIHFTELVFQVIWAIGISMILLGLLIRLPFKWLLIIALLILFGHNILDYYEAGRSDFSLWYHFLHKSTFYKTSAGPDLLVFYPFLPWTGIMLLGYCTGKLFRLGEKERNRRLITAGAALVVLFVVLRAINLYGDPSAWSSQPSFLYSVFSFINTTKYPPSLLYTCMTIGPALIFLGVVGHQENRLSDMIITYGRVPFFYYVIHFFMIHLLSAIAFLLRGHSFQEGIRGVPEFDIKFLVPGEGYSLAAVYLVWLLVVLLLFPLCRWYGKYKSTHKNWWLSYL